MKFCLRIVLLLFLVTATLSEGGLDLFDALDDAEPTSPTPKEQPKAPEKPKTGDELDLGDALGPAEPTQKPKKPSSGDSGGGTLSDSDLADVSHGDYKPDSSGGGRGRAADSGYDHQGGEDQPQDPDFPWDQILKLLNANFPEEFYMWISNLNQILTPLIERVRDLLQAMP